MPWRRLEAGDVVVIPARNEERSIGTVVSYLLENGLSAEQVLVVDSGSTDQTVERARIAVRKHRQGNVLRVVDPVKLFEQYRHSPERTCRVEGCEGTLSCVGKGAAMYAATLMLTHEGHPAESRIFFLDGDITNPEESDPFGSLLRAWEHKPGARIAKLASEGRENEGMLAFINTLPPPYNQLSNLAWPLCGQQSIRLVDLQQIPFAAGYSVETGFLIALIERFGNDCFTQEPIPAKLVEEKHPGDFQRYTTMFTSIMLFLRDVIAKGGLAGMRREDICAWNRAEGRMIGDIGVPRVDRSGVHRETIEVDALLPPLSTLVAR